MRDELWSFCAITLMVCTIESGSTSQTFRASIRASRTPLEGREVMYLKGACKGYDNLSAFALSEIKKREELTSSPRVARLSNLDKSVESSSDCTDELLDRLDLGVPPEDAWLVSESEFSERPRTYFSWASDDLLDPKFSSVHCLLCLAWAFKASWASGQSSGW